MHRSSGSSKESVRQEIILLLMQWDGQRSINKRTYKKEDVFTSSFL